MASLLESIGYNSWVLPALLLIPLIGAVVLLAVPARDQAAGGGVENPVVRQLAFWFFVLEFVVSLGLWWSYDPANSRMAGFDRHGLDSDMGRSLHSRN